MRIRLPVVDVHYQGFSVSTGRTVVFFVFGRSTSPIVFAGRGAVAPVGGERATGVAATDGEGGATALVAAADVRGAGVVGRTGALLSRARTISLSESNVIATERVT
jgi:hypothetical protein